MFEDFVMNGVGHGSVGKMLHKVGWDTGALRPFRSDDIRDPRSFVQLSREDETGKHVPKVFTTNANATLPVRAWIELDREIMQAAGPKLRAVGDLRSRGLEYNIPNGMAKTVYQYQTESRVGSAEISMDGVRRDKNDRSVVDLRNLPMPIIHSDFEYTWREQAVSTNAGNPMNVTNARGAAKRVAEKAESLLLGTAGTFAYGGGTIYGYTNCPNRLTYTMVDPTSSGWVPKDTYNDVTAMKKLSIDQFHTGPWVLYVSHEWSTILDDDYSALYPGVSLRDRLMKINNITDIVVLDFLTGYQMLLVEMDAETIQMIVGMEMTVVEWPDQGGMIENYKVMCILVPLIRWDFYNQIGLVHGNIP